MPTSLILVLALFVLVATALSRLRHRDLSRSNLQWFRLFFPSWRFFEDFNATPRLLCRARRPGSDFEEWSESLPSSPRHFQNLYFNPDGQTRLAVLDAVDRLLTDASDPAAPQSMATNTTYRMVQNAAFFHLRNAGWTPPFQFQFRITLEIPRAPEEELMTSMIHEGTST